ncbi:hypothetical protein [Streptomyces sp. KHY 26]
MREPSRPHPRQSVALPDSPGAKVTPDVEQIIRAGQDQDRDG